MEDSPPPLRLMEGQSSGVSTPAYFCAQIILTPLSHRPFSVLQVTISKVLSSVGATTQQVNAAPPPCGRSSPPGHAVVDGWRRDERTRDTPQSLPRSLVSSAKPTTAVQVVRPAAPTASTRSLRMPTEQGHSALDSQKPTLAEGLSAAPGEVDPTTPTTVRQPKIDPPFIFDPHRKMRRCDLSCGSCDH